MKNHFSKNRIKVVVSSVAENCKLPVLYVSGAINAILATDAATSIDRYMRGVFETAPTVYDKAMDAWREFSHNYGPDHRLFDGGHDLAGAWQSVHDAIKDDSTRQEVFAFFEAYWKDLVTPKGMPIVTLEKENFEKIAEFAASLGVETNWLKDLASYTASEGAGALAAVIGASLAWRRTEIEKFSEHAAAIAGASALAANPIALTIAIILIARSIHVGRQQNKLDKVLENFGWGAAKTSAFVGAAAVVGGSAWLGVVSGIAASILVSKLKDNFTKAPEEYEQEFVVEKMTNLLQTETVLLLEYKPEISTN
tara:strand:- start:39 stop:968 length:930 start_codon:yes stop_codon:yes gene_type:complete